MASTYLSKTFSSADSSGNGQKKFTVSAWVKKSLNGSHQDVVSAYKASNGFQTDAIRLYNSDMFGAFSHSDSGGSGFNVRSNALLRDPNAWYHLVTAVDSTQSTASDRVKLYINGEQVTSFSTVTYPAQDESFIFGMPTDAVHEIGAVGTSAYFDGVMSHVHICFNQQYDASAFGETDSTTGEWKIKTSPSVSYGSIGGFYLKDAANGTDYSSNSNTYTVNGTLTLTQDNPSNVFCVMNPLQIPMPSETPTFQNGNTRVYGNSNHWMRSYGTIGANSGKWWHELYIGTADASGRVGWDSIDKINDGDDNYYSGLTIQQTTGTVRGGIVGTSAYSPNAVQLPADGGGNATFSQGDYLGMGIDLDNNTITIHKNGSALATNWSYNGYNSSCKANTYGTFVSPSVNWYSASGNQNIYDFNFGNGKFGSSAQLTGTTYTDSAGRGVFKYQPPTNYLAWCTRNLNE